MRKRVSAPGGTSAMANCTFFCCSCFFRRSGLLLNQEFGVVRAVSVSGCFVGLCVHHSKNGSGLSTVFSKEASAPAQSKAAGRPPAKEKPGRPQAGDPEPDFRLVVLRSDVCRCYLFCFIVNSYPWPTFLHQGKNSGS